MWRVQHLVIFLPGHRVKTSAGFGQVEGDHASTHQRARRISAEREFDVVQHAQPVGEVRRIPPKLVGFEMSLLRNRI